MKRRCILLFVASLMGWSYANPLEVVSNGNFKKRANHWIVSRAPDYGDDGHLRISNGVFSGKKLRRSSSWYLNLLQPVDIRKGTKYKIKFDMMGKSEGEVKVSVAHPRIDGHFWADPITPGIMWKTYEYEFTGKFDTDQEWLKNRKEAFAKNKIEKGVRTPWKEQYPIADDIRGPPSRSMLGFALGDIKGDVMIRNISIVEVK